MKFPFTCKFIYKKGSFYFSYIRLFLRGNVKRACKRKSKCSLCDVCVKNHDLPRISFNIFCRTDQELFKILKPLQSLKSRKTKKKIYEPCISWKIRQRKLDVGFPFSKFYRKFQFLPGIDQRAACFYKKRSVFAQTTGVLSVIKIIQKLLHQYSHNKQTKEADCNPRLKSTKMVETRLPHNMLHVNT